ESQSAPDDLKITSDAEAEELLKDEFKGEIPKIEFEPLWVYVENEGGFSNSEHFWREFEDEGDFMETM
ncbi:MAG: hypothetical protein IIC46_06520, partial [Planctomycetes bacterium]|nr:hypothetical protein [Planctomycetota bacterium]